MVTSSQNKNKIIEFYKARIAYFYDGDTSVIDFDKVENHLRGEVDEKVSEDTKSPTQDFVGGQSIHLEPPMAAFAANFFQVIGVRRILRV